MTEWRYSAERHRYLYPSGRAVPASRVLGLRQGFIDTQMKTAESLARSLASGDLSVAQWERAVRALQKRAFVAEYSLGAGGRYMMGRQDYGRIGGLLGNQYRFLRSFAQDIADGKLSEAQIAERTKLYLASATQAYERGKASGYAGLVLPAFPADGSMPCRCRCAWRIDEKSLYWECTWVIRPGDSCSVCLDYATRWAPLIVAKDEEA